jgi:O-antigen/teichoic acid export membrane protein
MIRIFGELKKIMASSQKGIEDVALSIVPRVIAILVGIIISIVIARGLGPEDMGKYTLILSVSTLVAGLTDIGISQTAIRFSSQAAARGNKEDQFSILRWAFRFRLLLIIIITGTMFFLAPIVSDKVWNLKEISQLIRLSLLVGVFTAVASLAMVYYQSLKRFKMYATVNIIQSVISLLGILFLIFIGYWSLKIIIMISVVASVIGAVISVILVPKGIFFSLKETTILIKKKISNFFTFPIEYLNESERPNKFAVYMMLSSVVVIITMKADVWLMGYFLSSAQIGIYSVAMRFALPLDVLLNGLSTALWPRASSLNDITKIMGLLKKTLKVSLILSIFVSIYSLVVPLFTTLIFGESYEETILLAQILCFRYAISILVCPIGVIGYSYGLVRAYWYINIIQLIIVIGINISFLPTLGPVASALALAANTVIGAVISGLLLWHRINKSKSKVISG